MFANPQPPRIHLPKGWQDGVKSAVLHAIALAHYAIVYARAWAADSINARVRLAAENDRLHEECALLREELRIKDTRMAQIAPQRRPHYGAHERMAILELRVARGWSAKQTADTFLVTPATIAAWLKRIDNQGANALLQLREPVNKFPDFVRYIVQRLKTLSPAMGKVKIAETLCRAGLHLGTTTVGRILKEAPRSDPGGPAPCTSVVTAKHPNHIWHIDLTAIPTSTSRSIQKFLEHTMKDAGAHPKYIISDKGQQFWCDLFKDWCERQGINPRFGAVGQHGSIALIERFMLTLKNECMRIILVPLRTDAFQQELSCFSHWYNHCRPHSSLNARTPQEVYNDVFPAACERPRHEPRAKWPRSSPCASPHAPIAGHCGAPIRLDVRYHKGRKHLPIVALRRAA